MPDTLWMVEPHDSVIVRDGRPFSATESYAVASSLPFVPPSVIAGAVRGRQGSDRYGMFDNGQRFHVQKTKVRGPFLVHKLNDRTHTYFLPRPADSLMLDEPGQQFRMLRPQPNHFTNLSNNLIPLYPTGQMNMLSKPILDKALYWSDSQYRRWLYEDVVVYNPQNFLDELPRDWRMHVTMDAQTHTAKSGGLFATQGLTWRMGTLAGGIREFAMIVMVDSSLDNAIQTPPVIDTFGGEQRLVHWHKTNVPLPTILQDSSPDDLINTIVANRRCRMLLLTPGYFTRGWLPDIVAAQDAPIVRAVAINRGEFYSGWDILGNTPKHAMRCAPAGTVYFLEFPSAYTDNDIRAWVLKWWMQSVSDQSQLQHDGFGIAIFGQWRV